MHGNLANVCDVIGTPRGGQLLELMASVYKGIHDEESLAKETSCNVLDLGINLGLLKSYKEGQVILTSEGYLIANIAKEYANWVNNGRQMPPPYPPDEFIKDRDVLDLGCSFGRWLWRFQKNAKSVIGLEMQREYIELGRALAKREHIPIPEIRAGSAEELSLHVAENSVDFVFSRLVLNHVYIERTLLQIVKVLREGGIVWVQPYSWLSPYRSFIRSDKGREFRHKALAAFGIVNSMVFMTTHRQMSLRVQGRMHAAHKPVYPTTKTWKAAFARVGLTQFQEKQNEVFWARKS